MRPKQCVFDPRNNGQIVMEYYNHLFVADGTPKGNAVKPETIRLDQLLLEIFSRLFLSLTGISDDKNKNYPLWDQKSSLLLGSEIIEARNQRIW